MCANPQAAPLPSASPTLRCVRWRARRAKARRVRASSTGAIRRHSPTATDRVRSDGRGRTRLRPRGSHEIGRRRSLHPNENVSASSERSGSDGDQGTIDRGQDHRRLPGARASTEAIRSPQRSHRSDCARPRRRVGTIATRRCGRRRAAEATVTIATSRPSSRLERVGERFDEGRRSASDLHPSSTTISLCCRAVAAPNATVLIEPFSRRRRTADTRSCSDGCSSSSCASDSRGRTTQPRVESDARRHRPPLTRYEHAPRRRPLPARDVRWSCAPSTHVHRACGDQVQRVRLVAGAVDDLSLFERRPRRRARRRALRSASPRPRNAGSVNNVCWASGLSTVSAPPNSTRPIALQQLAVRYGWSGRADRSIGRDWRPPDRGTADTRSTLEHEELRVPRGSRRARSRSPRSSGLAITCVKRTGSGNRPGHEVDPEEPEGESHPAVAHAVAGVDQADQRFGCRAGAD